MNDRGLHDLSQDTVGFGRAEWNTIRDSVLRPRQLLEAYMTAGPDGGGEYARPLKLYLLLCGILMLVLFLMGGTESMMSTYPDDMFASLAEQAGKSTDAFIADVDGWVSLTLVPVMATLYALAAAPLIRWWDKEDLGWRKSFRASFAYMNALTIPVLPFSFMAYRPSTAAIGGIIMGLFALIAFMRMGSPRWYRSPFPGVAKFLVLCLATGVVSLVRSIMLGIIGTAGALFAP